MTKALEAAARAVRSIMQTDPRTCDEIAQATIAAFLASLDTDDLVRRLRREANNMQFNEDLDSVDDGISCLREAADALAAKDAEIAALKARVVELEAGLNLALEYWAHRMRRYKNRSPVWVENARALLSEGKP